ncbi:hypothetical protein BDB00DRAFT_753099 [Zychaea mexicana]|uniref:uncharacterized protein n=1 Tax=Zychaea mexicana TaxID=64656 RepID=UPI0022FE0EB6|nr:uncharacterized protein BDB00DRAFT_753099 [Zychaea mexicana]KAI9499709.1 hypothetical protein BDB00DRAFT_753099 [Zychaea mexicana]
MRNDSITSTSRLSSPEQLFQTKKAILLTLGQCLLQYGSPCHRVEDTLRHAAKMLAIEASFSIVPDLVLVSMAKTYHHDDTSKTLTIKSAQSFDTGKLVRVTKTMNNLYKGDLSLEDCLASLHEIIDSPATCGNFAVCFSFAAIGFSASVCMFNGSWLDASLAAGLGLIVAVLFIASMNFPVYGPVFEVSACIIVGIFGRVLHDYVCFSKVAVSSILILLPGYGMTMAVMEISAHQVTTGAIRLIYAVIYAFMLAYGLQIGSSVYMAINPSIQDEGTCGDPISPWFYLLLFPVMSISIGLAYGSSRHQWATQTACAAIGFCVLYFLGKIVTDAQILSTIAAFAMGLYANFALKLTGDPPLAPLCVGITLLVPGSIGVRDAFALLHQNDLSQGLYPIHMLRIALGLSVGLYASAMIVYPTGKLRSLYISL